MSENQQNPLTNRQTVKDQANQAGVNKQAPKTQPTSAGGKPTPNTAKPAAPNPVNTNPPNPPKSDPSPTSINKPSEPIRPIEETIKDLFGSKSLELDAAKSISDSERKKEEGVKTPTQGRIVTFFFGKEDGICTNNIIDSLPAMVIEGKDLVISLSVHTLDTRDAVVVRKAIPHKSLTGEDIDGNPNKPYWDWPVIK